MNVRDAVWTSIDHAGYRRVSASAALVALLLAGCSTNDSWLVDPGHYSAFHCDALPARLNAIQERRKELSSLMARASDGGGGVLIGAMSYRADYEKTIGEEKALRHTAAEKNCNLPPPAPPVTPTPAAYTPPPAPTAPPAFQSDQAMPQH